MANFQLTDEFFKSFDSSIVDVNQAETLPPLCYADREFFEFEKDAIFRHEWLCVGREDWAKNPGDYFTTSHIGEPIVVVRTGTGALKALSSVCQHRAMLVAEGRGNTRAFLCPYHHWSYSLDGQLVGAPAMEQACNFDKSTIRLAEFKVETWLGFVFINFDLSAPALAPRLTAVTEALTNFDLAAADGSPAADADKFPWNWKVSFENLNDGYHANRLHHGPVHDVVPSHLSVFPKLPADTAGYFRFNGSTHQDFSTNPTLKAVLPIFPKLTNEERNRMMFANIPPSLSLVIRSDTIAFIILHAETHETVLHERGWLVAPGATQQPLFQERLMMNVGTNAAIVAQDLHVDALIQIGVRSQFAARGRYSWQEQAQWEFNNWLVKRYRSEWARQRQSDVMVAERGSRKSGALQTGRAAE